MKIKVLLPTPFEGFQTILGPERRGAAFPGTEVDVVSLSHGPVSIEFAYDEALAAPYILEEARKAEEEGYDAMTVDCAMDPALRAVREAVSIPVVHAGESAYITALALGSKFSVITVLDNTAKIISENLHKYGLSSRVASVRSTKLAVLELEDEERAEQAILAEAKKAIEEDGAEVIVLGCTGMSTLVQKLRKELGVPVIDPGATSVKLAEALVSMGLSHSKAAYMTPAKKDIL